MRLSTKLRPFARSCMAAAQGLAELQIYTHCRPAGPRPLLPCIPPHISGCLLLMTRKIPRTIRASTALTRCGAIGDSTQQCVTDLDMVLGAELLAVVVDDMNGVWPSRRDKLVQVGDLVWVHLRHMPSLTVMLIGCASKQMESYIFFPACE